ncbi:hypothetical protein CGZ80_14205 [Rhodopirellula sp. MGV]|nr:hypothetical protein CGZ80_14205 [Rhodopirellula sp. MGV]PNY36741.1 hypothetical protein C2E31_11545 [Rhodopirellula baltica]
MGPILYFVVEGESFWLTNSLGKCRTDASDRSEENRPTSPLRPTLRPASTMLCSVFSILFYSC